MIRTGALLGVAVMACVPIPADDDHEYPRQALKTDGKAVAVIGPVTLTTSEIEARIARQSPFVRGQLRDPQKRRAFIEKEVRLEILAQEAWRRGLHQDPDVLRRVRQVVIEKLIQDEMRRNADALKVSDQAVEEAYIQQKHRFVRPPAVRLGEIVRYVKDDRERRAARRKLDEVRRTIGTQERNGARGVFEKTARKASENADTRASGGDIGFVTRSGLVARYDESVAQRMFDELKIGDLVLVETATTVALVKKRGVRRGVNQTLNQVKPQLRRRLAQERRGEALNAFVERLIGEHRVKMVLDGTESIPSATGSTRRTSGGKQ